MGPFGPSDRRDLGVVGHSWVVSGYRHLHRHQTLCDGTPCIAQTNEAHVLPGKADARRLGPSAVSTDLSVDEEELSGQAHDISYRNVRDLRSEHQGGIRHRNPELTKRVEVDVVDPHTPLDGGP